MEVQRRISNCIFNIFLNSVSFNRDLFNLLSLSRRVKACDFYRTEDDKLIEMRSYLLADHHGRGHVPGGAANNAQLIKSEDEEEAHQAGDGPLSAAAARQQHIALKTASHLRCSVNSLLPHCICNVNEVSLNFFS